MNMVAFDMWKKIREIMPMLCVDVVISCENKYLLLKRKNIPLKGEWWVPGGSLRKWETFEEAVEREIKDELGIPTRCIESIELKGIVNLMFPNSNVHTPSVIHYVKINRSFINLNNEHSDYKWVDELPEDAACGLKDIFETALS